jgi:hypothetical protein
MSQYKYLEFPWNAYIKSKEALFTHIMKRGEGKGRKKVFSKFDVGSTGHCLPVTVSHLGLQAADQRIQAL